MKRSAILAVSLLALPATADNPRFMQAILDGYQEVPSVATRAKVRTYSISGTGWS